MVKHRTKKVFGMGFSRQGTGRNIVSWYNEFIPQQLLSIEFGAGCANSIMDHWVE